MDTVQITRILIAFAFLVNFSYPRRVHKHEQSSTRNCAMLYMEPNFNSSKVLGTWKIYYTWTVSFTIDGCVEMTFKVATSELIKRIYNDLYDYLEQQPSWNSATIHVSTTNKNHEVLLIPDQDRRPNGSFIGILNLLRAEHLPSLHQPIPTVQFFIKLINDRYLLMIDCSDGGVASLSAKRAPRHKQELEAVVESLPLGEGRFTCAFT